MRHFQTLTVSALLSAALLASAASAIAASSGWSLNDDGTATNNRNGKRVIVGLDGTPGTADDNRLVNPAGLIVLNEARLSLDSSSHAYVALGNGFNVYPGADGRIGTTDDVIDGFGSYPQSDAQDTTKQPLEWRILDITVGQATLITSVLVDAIKFNLNAGDGNDWSTSNLRSWLNSNGGQNLSGDTTGFYNAAFSDAEKAKIIPTQVRISGGTFVAYNRLLTADHWQTYPASSMTAPDKVWTLSGVELFMYFGRTKRDTQGEMQQDPNNYTNAYFTPSDYAKAQGVKINVGGNGPSFVGFGDAWTRSAGAPTDGINYYGVFLGSTGSLNSGRPVNTVYGVLPVITVSLSK